MQNLDKVAKFNKFLLVFKSGKSVDFGLFGMSSPKASKNNSMPILDPPMTSHQFSAESHKKPSKLFNFFSGELFTIYGCKEFYCFPFSGAEASSKGWKWSNFSLSAKSIKYFLLFHNSLALKGILPTSLEFNCSKTTINFNFSICFWLWIPFFTPQFISELALFR